MHNPNGVVIYQGPSMLTGEPIVAIATGLKSASNNAKTGAMIQTWILPANVEPHIAVKSGEDSMVCGTCPFSAGNGCYVIVHNAPLSVWKAWKADRYAASDGTEFRGRMVRLGSYGDPAAVPFEVWESILEGVTRHTGYTHQWRSCDPRFASIVMASVEKRNDVYRAESLGWRTFYVTADQSNDIEMERSSLTGRKVITCPASAEAGHRTTCEECGLCDGTYALDKRAHIRIRPHGAKANRTVKAVS